MNIQRKRFITLTLGDTESWGYDELTLPMLLQIVDASAPDYRMFTHLGVLANYRSSSQGLDAVEEAIKRAEGLRDSDSRFATLGIGLAEGELTVEFDRWGRLKLDRLKPMGATVADADQVQRVPGRYREILQSLRTKPMEATESARGADDCAGSGRSPMSILKQIGLFLLCAGVATLLGYWGAAMSLADFAVGGDVVISEQQKRTGAMGNAMLAVYDWPSQQLLGQQRNWFFSSVCYGALGCGVLAGLKRWRRK